MNKTTEFREGKAGVKVIYYTSKTLADGSHPLLVRITKDGKRKYITTGESLLPRYWNAEKSGFREAIRKSYPDPSRDRLINRLIEFEKKYMESAGELADGDQQHTADAVAAKAIEGRKASRRVQLLAYIGELVAGMVSAGRTGNAIVYRDLGNQLAKFIQSGYGVKDVPFERVTVSFCNEWEDALRATGAEDTTISNRFRTLRAVLNKAYASGTAKTEHYPFARNVADKHKFSVGKFDVSTAKRAISREEVRRIEALEPTTARHQLAKDVFLFSFYCGGINFVDLAQLRWQDLSGADENGQPRRLNYVRQKTGGKFSLPLLAPAAVIVTAFRPLTYAAPDSYVFPIIDKIRHATTTRVTNRLHKVLGQVNKDLKELGQLAGIATPLTTYVARHTFATMLRMSGAGTAIISQAMGHKSEAVTAVYLDSFASELVDTAFEGLLWPVRNWHA